MTTEEIRRIGFTEEDGRGLKFGIVSARANADVVEPLVTGTKESLLAKGVAHQDLRCCTVQRPFDLPYAAKAMMRSDDSLDGIICLGCIIRDENIGKFDYESEAVARGIMKLNEGKVPVVYGVLTCLNEEQALTFIGKASEHDAVSVDHGPAYAQTLVELARLSKRLDEDAEEQP
jgi:6,7-dimethyl-8-ribityllumazine synthase|uniref:6,7-dimethyl-8-ribityllumazine synthase n=1 Tax=Globisporangium ultimum (strain ATCC 200006 / CBS 805.95 / DAOM BR144) TaxID=431595 RepID=K3X567_GLOUD